MTRVATPQPVRVRAAQVALQHGDPRREKKHDIKALFERAQKRKLWWLGGTEAGQPDTQELLHDYADEYDYRLFISHSLWVAVSRDVMLAQTWEQHWTKVVDAGEGVGDHFELGIASVHWESKELGLFNVGETHWIRRGRTPGQTPHAQNYKINQRLAEACNDWGREHGRGSSLAVIQGDLNVLVTKDPFQGGPWSIFADEVGHHESTGHGEIDVMAKYRNDRRMEVVGWKVFNDREMPLFTDHFYCEADMDIYPPHHQRHPTQ